jgi:hypothetical protein
MLTSEDRDVLGMASEAPVGRRRTAVSQVLRAIKDAIVNPAERWDDFGEADSGEFKIAAAADRSTRERAYRLAQRAYHSAGYVSTSEGLCASVYDTDPQTFTILAEDRHGREAGTLSLAFDSVKRLPCDEIYGEELNCMRAEGRWLTEVTRLAIDKEYAHSKALLVRMFNCVSVFARQVRRYTDMVIEVNPRHVDYYRRLLAFKTAGPERPCLRVNGAPAVLLRLNLSEQESIIRRIAGQRADARERSLYAYFLPLSEEAPVADFLARQHRPMTAADAVYFGLAQPACPPVRELANA